MTVPDEKVELLFIEVSQIKKHGYESLHLKFDHSTAYLLGQLDFIATFDGEKINDSYSVEIQFPTDYPLKPPTVKETGGRIPRIIDHHVNPDHTLCLGPPIELLSQFRRYPNVLGFIEKLVIPKLFWHSYNQIHLQNPLPAYSHGDEGIAEYREKADLQAVYFGVFKTNKLSLVLLFLEMIINNTYSNNQNCPCGSGKLLNECHGALLLSVATMPYMKSAYLARDYWYLKDKHRSGKNHK